MNWFDDSTRRRLATGWNPRVITLREYARQNGVSERALRNWRRKYGVKESPPVPPRHPDVPAGAAADALLAKLAALDQAVDAARAALSAVRAALDEGSAGAGVTEEVVSAERRERQPSPPAEAASVTTREPPAAVEVPTEPVPKPLPMRRSYFLDFQ